MLGELWASIRLVAATMVVFSGCYTALVLLGAVAIAPDARVGSLVEHDGRVVGSRLVAQAFTRPEYLWPRPSAVNYAANAAGGSNLSPANPLIRERAVGLLDALGASPDRPAPAELVLASGSGLDPHVTAEGARFQAARIARARAVPEGAVAALIDRAADTRGLVNVLEFNLLLDAEAPAPPQ